MKIKNPKFLWPALAVSVFLALTIGSCKKDKFVESPGVCPVVTLTNPLNGALAVPLEQVIVVKFNEELNPATVNAACFELKSATNVEGVLTYNNQSASMTFVPNAPLSSNTTYTGIVKTSIRDMRGNALQREYIWSFSTGIILAPVVTFTEPFNAETGVVLNKIIKAHFSVPMDPTSIKDSSFTLKAGAISIPGVVTYLDSTAVFTPINDLIPNTVYTATITTMAKTLGKTNLANNYVWDFTTLSLQAPYVTLTNPVGTSTNVPLNQVVTASFNVPMDPLSIKDSSFKLMQGANVVLGSVSYTDTTASFTPTVSLLPNTLYTARITNMAQDKAGTNMVSDFVWTFTTAGVLAPTVILVDPLNLAPNVALDKVLTATFSEPMNAATITTSSFTVKLGVTPIAGVVTYSGNKATFTPSANLIIGSTYTATITTLAKNLAGTALTSNFIWTFTTVTPIAPTVILVDPTNLATNIPLNKVIKATFSEAMNASTINSSSFTLKLGVTPVAGIVTYSGIIASFTPSANLVAGTVYTATISTLAKNLAGTAIASNYVWTFTTAAAIAPTVILVDPTNLETNVLLNKIVTANFSVPMDPATIGSSSFTLKLGVTPVSGIVSYSGTTATFTPSSNLISGNTYTATITTLAKNLAGTPIASDFVWTFNTLASIAPTVVLVDPINLATNVLLNKVISANFSMPMDGATINTSSFTLKLGVIPVTGIVSYSGTTATFTPSSNLLSGNTYTATITTFAKNLAGTPLASNFVWTFNTKAPAGPLPPNLLTVARFGIISGVGVSNNAGFSVINNMDVGISPGVRSSVTGFPPAIVVGGAIYASDDILPVGAAAMLLQAKSDLTAAYLFAKNAVLPAPATVSGDQGGLTLAPGIYKSTSTLLVQNGNLTLDAQGDVNAVWIFQVATSFTTIGGSGGSIILTNGAQAKNIFWQVGSSATIGDNTAFKGNLLVLTSITLNSNATLQGRVLCSNGAVVLTSTNILTKP